MRGIKLRIAALTVVALGAVVSTGCMMTPGHGEHVGNKTSPISFMGATSKPGQLIAIQAKTRDGRWETFATARTSTYAYNYSGSKWYVWSRTMTLNHKYWNAISPSDWYAEVRAVDLASGDLLATWEDGFFDYLDVSVPLDEMAQEHLSGTTATIYGSAP